ncbi:MAG: YihY/virulence factor BrkB family protein [Acidimicrobiales bacterium]|nr:YihY/virulence factor BrkB family protein [Acidimicrobiales bacterium]MBO0894419.1 YihY/virulence factor BrkB family protein [Acidimicrobiales bacterium]
MSKSFVRDRISISAGSLAYHWFLALFPAVIAAFGFLALAQVGTSTVNRVVHGVEKALPPGVSGVFSAAVHAATKQSSGSLVAVVVGIAVALWSASASMSVLQQTLDVVYGVPVDRKFMARRARALPMMIATAVLGGVGAGVIVFGAPIASAIHGHVGLTGTPFNVVWTVVRWVVAVLAISLLFSVYYYLGPNREVPRWRWITAGGLFASALVLVASLGFSFYVTRFGSYGETYGTFAGVVILIFWFYLVGLAALVGAEINADTEQRPAVQRGQPTPVAAETR